MHRVLPFLFVALVSMPAQAGDGEKAKPVLPAPGALNPHVLAVLANYPTDGTHGYHWPKKGSWLGFTRTLTYRGKVLGKGDAKGRCHCSGITFEVFFRAWERWAKAAKRPFVIGDLDPKGLRRFVSEWFGASGDRATLHAALTGHGFGTRVTDWEKARPGDFVQLWRHSGSGHSCIFLAWVRKKGKIVGLRYWSTQSSTRGIGERAEFFGKAEEGRGVKREELYIVRVGTK